MSRSSLRKLAAAGLGAALIGSGLTVGLGAGVASAASECKISETVVNDGGIGGKFTMKKTVLTPEVAPGGKVTYETVVQSNKTLPPLGRIGDFHPAGFVVEKAEVESYHAGIPGLSDGQSWEDVTPTASSGVNSAIVQGPSGGWTMIAGNTVTLRITYKVPESAQVGSELTSGGMFKPTTWNNDQEYKDMGVCVTVRDKTIVEAGAGSLDAIGLGSVNTGSGQIFGSLTDPQGSLSNVIGGVLENAIGS